VLATQVARDLVAHAVDLVDAVVDGHLIDVIFRRERVQRGSAGRGQVPPPGMVLVNGLAVRARVVRYTR